MVKLRVAVRVIPEDVYLTQARSDVSTSNYIIGEKKFYIIVRDPEAWYVGKLANEVKVKYQSLYNRDLGEIKYLKDNQNDCDLDPEERVSDLLVDEGRALTDKSDQHATIKIIQEQGRAIREGSVVPDLSHPHYQARPPVPRFESLETTLGKRKSVEDTSADFTFKRHRSRLSEIENESGNNIVASIEKDCSPQQPVQDSQHSESLKALTNGVASQTEKTPEFGWSFTQLGPPVATEAPRRTPMDSSTKLASSVHNTRGDADEATSSTKASSSSKKFQKSRKDIYAFPESDIDDSQMSPRSMSASKITPRLVPSKAISQRKPSPTDLERNLPVLAALSSIDDDAIVPNKKKNLTSGADRIVSELSDSRVTNQSHANPFAALKSIPDSTATRSAAVVTTPDYSTQDADGQDQVSDLVPSTQVAASRATSVEQSTPVAPEAGLKRTRKRPTVSSELHSSKGVKRDVLSVLNNEVHEVSTPRSPLPSHSDRKDVYMQQSAQDGIQQGKKNGVSKGRLVTPGTASPGEQLSQSLQESARRSMMKAQRSAFPSSKSTISNVVASEPARIGSVQPKMASSPTRSGPYSPHAAEGRLGLGITNSPRSSKMRDIVSEATPVSSNNSKNNKSVEKPVSSLKLADNSTEDSPASTRKRSRKKQIAAENTESAYEHVQGAAPGEGLPADNVAIPRNPTTSKSKTAAKTSEANPPIATASPAPTTSNSTGKNVTKSFPTILPPGMTQEDYDRIIASNAHLNLESKRSVGRKRASTPALRKSVSSNTDQQISNVDATKALAKTSISKTAAKDKTPVPPAESLSAESSDTRKQTSISASPISNAPRRVKTDTILETLNDSTLHDVDYPKTPKGATPVNSKTFRASNKEMTPTDSSAVSEVSSTGSGSESQSNSDADSDSVSISGKSTTSPDKIEKLVPNSSLMDVDLEQQASSESGPESRAGDESDSDVETRSESESESEAESDEASKVTSSSKSRKIAMTESKHLLASAGKSLPESNSNLSKDVTPITNGAKVISSSGINKPFKPPSTAKQPSTDVSKIAPAAPTQVSQLKAATVPAGRTPSATNSDRDAGPKLMAPSQGGTASTMAKRAPSGSTSAPTPGNKATTNPRPRFQPQTIGIYQARNLKELASAINSPVATSTTSSGGILSPSFTLDKTTNNNRTSFLSIPPSSQAQKQHGQQSQGRKIRFNDHASSSSSSSDDDDDDDSDDDDDDNDDDNDDNDDDNRSDKGN